MSSAEMSRPSVSSCPGAGTSPIGVSTVSPSPSQRRQIHSRTRLLSPNPGQMKLPSSSLRNQLTRKIRGSFCGAVLARHPQPVAEVVGHVVAAERQHRHRVEAELAHLARGRRGRLDRHRGAEEDAVLPVERLGDEGHRARPPAAEQEGVDRHSVGVLPLGGDRGALGRGGREARVRVRRGIVGVRRPVVAVPVDRVVGRLAGHPLPPDVAVVGPGAVGEDRVSLDRLHRVRDSSCGWCSGRRRRSRPRD